MAGKLALISGREFEDRVNNIMGRVKSISENWKSYFGAAYYSRVQQAIAELKANITDLEQVLADDD